MSCGVANHNPGEERRDNKKPMMEEFGVCQNDVI